MFGTWLLLYIYTFRCKDFRLHLLYFYYMVSICYIKWYILVKILTQNILYSKNVSCFEFVNTTLDVIVVYTTFALKVKSHNMYYKFALKCAKKFTVLRNLMVH
jgi:hypothetical protein